MQKLTIYKVAPLLGMLPAMLGYAVLLWFPQTFYYVGWENVPAKPGLASDWIPILDPGVRVQKDILFPSEDDHCGADLYEPNVAQSKYRNNNNQVPIVIMGHGIGSTRDQGLQRFAEKFVNKGLAVLTMDYRTYGTSPGLPRHFLSPTRHTQDFKNAYAYVQTLPFVDKDRIVLWGSSYGGGHVIKAASELPNLRGVISQVPFLGTTPQESRLDEMKKRGWKVIGLGLMGAISANIRHWFRMPEMYGPVYAHYSEDPFRLAMNYWEFVDETEESWLEKHPKKRPNDWKNAALIRSLFDVLAYRPIDVVDKISNYTQVMYVGAQQDKLCPVNRIQYALKKTPKAEMIMLDCKHFDVYAGTPFEQNLRAQLEFLNRVLSI